MKNNITKSLNFNLDNIKNIPLTIIFTIIFAFIFSFKSLLSNNQLINQFSYFCTLFILIIANIFFVEILIKDKKKRIIGYILAFLLSILLNHISFSNLLLNTKCYISCFNDFSNYMEYFITGYILSIISITIYLIYRRSNMEFSKYISIVLNNLFKIFIIYFASSIGLFFIFILLDIVSKIDSKIVEAAYYLLFGLYVLPNIIISLIDINNKKISSIFEGISFYCILPVTVISMLIIYFYIFKILITKVMPDNLIFMLVSMVFIIGMVSYFICKNNENKITRIYFKIFPYTFILPVILQIYSVSIRFTEYGLTPSRYITYMFIIFEVLSVALLIYKNGLKAQNMLILIAILSVVTVASPFNLIRMSNINQANILNKYYNSNGKNYYKAVSAYKYLTLSEKGRKYISSKIDEKMQKEVNDKQVCKYRYKYFNNKFDKIDIKDYSSIKLVRNAISNNKNESSDIYNLKIINQNNNEYELTINIKSYIENLLDNEFLNDEIFMKNNKIQIDENSILYLSYIHLKYDAQNNKKIEKCNIRGYLLEK